MCLMMWANAIARKRERGREKKKDVSLAKKHREKTREKQNKMAKTGNGKHGAADLR